MYDSTDGYEGDPKLITVFDTECRGGPDCRLSQVVEGPIQFFSLCEHHALPFYGRAYVGYIAHEQIIGLSKLTRLVRLFAKRFTVQERIGQQIADSLDAMLHPHGVAVYLDAHHLCTQMRGVRETAPLTRTTFWRGNYENDPSLRTEFFVACGLHRFEPDPRSRRARDDVPGALDTLFDPAGGDDLPCPPSWRRSTAPSAFPLREGRPYVIGNFVTTMDGVAVPLRPRSGGRRPHQRLQPARQDGHGTVAIRRGCRDRRRRDASLRPEPPVDRGAYLPAAIRCRTGGCGSGWGRQASPWNVIVTARAEIDLDLPVFRSGAVKVLIVTNPEGARRLRERGLPASVVLGEAGEGDAIGAREVLSAVGRILPGEIVLVEGGPRLMGDFFAERCLDELFLTLAPQVAGRDGSVERPGFVAGKRFGPERPLWGTLAGVKRAGSHLFLRYGFPTENGSGGGGD